MNATEETTVAVLRQQNAAADLEIKNLRAEVDRCERALEQLEAENAERSELIAHIEEGAKA